jgi:hypothetical protein
MKPAVRNAHIRTATWNFIQLICEVLPGLDSGSCLSGPVRPPRLVVCVISGLPSARLSPEALLSYLPIYITCYRTCMHIRYRYIYQPPGAGPCLGISLAAPRGAAYLTSVLPVTRFWSKPLTAVETMSSIYLSMALLPPPCCLVRQYDN